MARLTVESGAKGGKSVEIGADRVVIGRDAAAAFVLDDEEASREHAYLKVLDDGRVEVGDLDSRNGTFVDGKQISEPTTLSGDAEIRVGQTTLRLSGVEPKGAGGETKISEQPPAVAAPAPEPPKERPSAIQRAKLQRTTRTAIVIAVVAVVLVVVGIVLVATGTFESEPPTPADIINDVRPSVVDVAAEKNGRPFGGGSGWVLDAEEGLVVTNAHVIGAGETFQAGLQGQLNPAQVVGVSPCDDLAVLKVANASGLQTLPLGSQSDLVQGDTVFVVGFPANATAASELQATSGIVSAVSEEADLNGQTFPDVVQTDAAINSGNSGGPMVDESATLVGVNTFSGTGDIENQGYAIGVNHVKEIVTQLRQGTSLGWAGFGIIDVLSDGILVTRSVRGTSAARAKIGRIPILLQRVNGQSVTTPDAYCDAVEGLKSGQKMTISGLVLTPTGGGQFKAVDTFRQGLRLE